MLDSIKQEYEWSLAFAGKLLQLLPEDPIGLRTAGEALVRLGKFERAIPIGEKLVNLEPLNPAGYLIVADAYAWNYKWREAIPYYKKSLPLLEESSKAGIFSELSRAYKATNDLPRAISSLEKYIGYLEADLKTELDPKLHIQTQLVLKGSKRDLEELKRIEANLASASSEDE